MNKYAEYKETYKQLIKEAINKELGSIIGQTALNAVIGAGTMGGITSAYNKAEYDDATRSLIPSLLLGGFYGGMGNRAGLSTKEIIGTNAALSGGAAGINALIKTIYPEFGEKKGWDKFSDNISKLV